jgi:hypothetical protein
VSVYNTLHVKMACPVCSDVADRQIQFRYGHVRLHDYVIGARVVWGPDAEGDPRHPRVVVDGWLDECEQCGFEGRHAVFIRENTVWGVGPIAWVPELPDQGWVSGS